QNFSPSALADLISPSLEIAATRISGAVDAPETGTADGGRLPPSALEYNKRILQRYVESVNEGAFWEEIFSGCGLSCEFAQMRFLQRAAR
ncbi:MAG: hypothetical protein LUD69_01935, partial [Oscillospiraceae bacterium]|nr:hypothetical protein [Oscillospiraceae bacterium]